MDGIVGLIEKKRGGRPKKLSEREEKEAIELVNEQKLKNSACRNNRKNGHKN
jgi:transposase